MISFVGAGPGAVDLITVRGQRLLTEADVVIYAGSLVNPALLLLCGDDARVIDSQSMSLEEIVAEMARAEAERKKTVRLHTGDPSIYGAVREQMDALDRLGIPYESVPGVSALSGAAASLNMEYTLPDVTQTLIVTRIAGRTPVPDREQLALLAAHQTSMVIFLSAAHAERVQRELLAGGLAPDVPAAIVSRATWPEERKFLCTVGTLAETAVRNGIRRTALFLIGEAVAHRTGTRSRLYDAGSDNIGNGGKA